MANAGSFSFAPDRRSLQTSFYHFSERDVGEPSRIGFTQQDSLAWQLDKLYQSKFTNIPQQLRTTLVSILSSEISLVRKDLSMLAAAAYIVYDMRNKGLSMLFDTSLFQSSTDVNVQNTCLSLDANTLQNKLAESVNTTDQRKIQSKQIFDSYFNYVAPFIMSDMSSLSQEEILAKRANYKITLLRYIIYVEQNTTGYVNRA